MNVPHLNSKATTYSYCHRAIKTYNEIMLVDKSREDTSSFLEAMQKGESEENSWKSALEVRLTAVITISLRYLTSSI